jgi:hypothetical protein
MASVAFLAEIWSDCSSGYKHVRTGEQTGPSPDKFLLNYITSNGGRFIERVLTVAVLGPTKSCLNGFMTFAH